MIIKGKDNIYFSITNSKNDLELLNEIDTKYNMFFNDEDKKNLRIIIDYLKKKV